MGVPINKEERNMVCKLTDAEIQDRGVQLADKVKAIAAEAVRGAGIKKDLKTIMDKMVSEESELATTVQEGTESRLIVVVSELLENGQIREYREDGARTD
jgi:hypothetical protein